MSEGYKLKALVKKTLLMAGSGIISVLMSSWVWLPVAVDFGRGKLTESKKDIDFEIRNVFEVIRQFFPASYGGFKPSDGPNIYCGLIILLLFVLFLFAKKNSLKKRILVFSVVVFYILSMCIGYLDVLWHGLKIPTMFPARYSFTLSFFMICIAAESIGQLSVRFSAVKAYVKRVLCFSLVLFSAADLSFNAFFLIRCIAVDDFTGEYYDYAEYEIVKDKKEIISQLIGDDYSIVYSDYDFTKNDGLLFGNPGLDYFSSSYNNSFSTFLEMLGLNSLYHVYDDNGLNVASAYFFGVRYAAEYINGLRNLELYDYLEPVYSDSLFSFYRFKYSAIGGFRLNGDEGVDFTYNTFQNINEFYSDISECDGVFKECNTELISNELSEDGTNYIREILVHPERNSHLYFYVSPMDFMNSEGDYKCFDELYIGETRLAEYKDVGQRYIVDLGYSDGSPLNFTFITADPENEVFFYCFDDSAFEEAVNNISPLFTAIHYSSKGIEGVVETDADTQAVLLIPYENGFTVRIDGERVPYGNYRNGLVKIKIPEGKHDIEITYFTPGLKIGILISSFVFILFIISLLLERNIHINGHFNVQNAQKK